MSEPIKVQFTLFQPGKINNSGRVISKESFDKALKEYLKYNANKCLYFSNSTVFGGISHDINDICGKIDDIKEVDGKYIADARIMPSLPQGRICSEILNGFQDNMEVKPDGFYDPDTKNLTITGFGVSYKKTNKDMNTEKINNSQAMIESVDFIHQRAVKEPTCSAEMNDNCEFVHQPEDRKE